MNKCRRRKARARRRKIDVLVVRHHYLTATEALARYADTALCPPAVKWFTLSNPTISSWWNAVAKET